MSLSEPFIRRPVMTVCLTATTVLFGLLSYFNLRVSDLPDTEYPVIQVNVAYPGASPTTMANNVATPLEKQFLQISGISLITSQSTQGSTTFVLQFDLSKTIESAATDVQSAITQATGQLPVDLPSPPTYKKTNPNEQPIIYLALMSETLTLGQLYEYAAINVGQKISILQGVSSVDVYGAQPAVRVEVDPKLLASRGLTMDQLSALIQTGTVYQGAGQFDGKSRTFILNPQGQLATAEQYRKLIIGQQNGAVIRLGDVSKCEDTVQDTRISMKFWVRDNPIKAAAVVLAVSKAANGNAVEVAKAVKDLLPQFHATLPGSVTLVKIYDRSQSIINSVDDVQETLVFAFILVVLVIYIFLGRGTDTIIPSVTLPLSLLLTFVAMYALHYSIDNLSLMALTLAIGFLVDDAIVFLENAVRRMEAGESAMRAAVNGAKEISFTIMSMTLSLAAVFIPLVAMAGLMGRVFREFGVTIIIAIMASGVVSLTVTPLMCSRMLAGRGRGAKKTWVERVVGGFFQRVVAGYGRSLHFFLKYGWISVVVWILSVILSVYMVMILPKTFLPVGDSSFVRGVFIAQQGTSPDRMVEYQREVDATLQRNKSVDMVVTVAGLSGFIPSNFAFTLAFLTPPRGRPPIEEVTNQLRGALFQIPGILPAIRPQPVLQISTGATNQNQGKYAYALSGLDPEEVYRTARKILQRANGIPGIVKPVTSDMFLETPQLKIDFLRDQASTYGITAGDISSTIRNAYAQNYVYLIKRPTDQIQVIMEAAPDYRVNPSNLNGLYVKSSATGQVVPLNAVAKWEEVLGPQAVNHINQFTSVTIYFDVEQGASIGTVTDAFLKIANEEVPLGMIAGLQGEAKTFQDAFKSLGILFVFALFAMYIILGILYESYLHPLTVLSTVFSATVGGLATLLFFHQELSLYGFIGMFMLVGIVKKNGIMMVDFALQQMDLGKDRREAIHEACLERFRPILMTTLAALMGAVPMALGWGAAGSTRVSLGLMIIGGLVVSQLLTLYMTPVFFLFFEWVQERILDRNTFLRSSRVPTEGVAIEPETMEESPEGVQTGAPRGGN